jgi:hypothetical protein
MSLDAKIDPGTVVTLALAIRRSPDHSVLSHPQYRYIKRIFLDIQKYFTGPYGEMGG